MPRKAPQLVKLTRPRLHKAVARERLFARLDDARKIPGIWYQVDPGDADRATFFYCLEQAAKLSARNGQRPLPVLTPGSPRDHVTVFRDDCRRIIKILRH